MFYCDYHWIWMNSLFESIYVSQSLFSSPSTSSGYNYGSSSIQSITDTYLRSLCESVPAGHQLLDHSQSRPRAIIMILNDVSNSNGLRVETSLSMMVTKCGQILVAPSPELINRVGQYLRSFGDVYVPTGSRTQAVILRPYTKCAGVNVSGSSVLVET